MLYYDRTDFSEETDISKTSATEKYLSLLLCFR